MIEHDENEPVPIKGPDLVLTHKLRNAPVRMRTEIVRRAYNGEPLDYDPVDHDTPEGSVDAPIDHEAEEPAGTGAEPTLQDDMPDGEMAPVGTGIARPEEGIDPDVPEADA